MTLNESSLHAFPLFSIFQRMTAFTGKYVLSLTDLYWSLCRLQYRDDIFTRRSLQYQLPAYPHPFKQN
jgi:hypothetical protein